MLKKVGFALRNPRLTSQYVQREVLRRQRKRSIKTDHQPKSRSGTILPTNFFDTKPDLKAADRILEGELCLYGGHVFRIEGAIDWQKDYLSDFQWQGDVFSPDIIYNYPVGVDIKNPWELSRAHHLITVGLAYKATGEEKYAQYVVNSISHWIQNNPFYLGVNWKVAMEVGIRAANWLLAYDLIALSPAATPEFKALFLGSLAEHGQFIMENLEYFTVRSNHYTSDLIGLIWIGLLCPDLPKAKRWLRYGIKEMEIEILHQFYPDGMNFEGSLAYDRLVLELIGYTALLLKNHHRHLSAPAQQRLQKAFTTLAALLKPNGQGPQFGDNDTGRFFIFSDYHHWNSMQLDYLLDLGQALFPDLVFDLAGTTHFSDGGLLVARQGPWQLNLEVAPIGQDGNGGHNHDDAGSFELTYGQTNIVVDPGTGAYTSNPEVRNHFRSALAHNAPIAPELVHQPPKLLFVGDQFTVGTLKNEWEVQLVAEKYEAERSLTLSETGLLVTDKLVSPQDTSLQTLLTFPPELLITKHPDGFHLGKELLLTTTSPAKLVQVDYSPAYATIVPTSAILIEDENQLSFSIINRPL